MRTLIRKARYWVHLLTALWRAARTPGDFAKMLRVRLAETPVVGRFAVRRPYMAEFEVNDLGKVRVRSHTSDMGVLEELVSARNYSHLPNMPVRTVVDLGANIGLATRWWHGRYPEARFVCVEPEPGNVRMLEANVPDGAVVVQACVGGYERGVSLTADSGDWSWRMDGDGEVRVLTMRTVLERAGFQDIDLLKCDIEGAEAELFADCSDWINGVKALVVECHGDFTAADLAECLQRNGGRFRTVYLEPNPAYGCETVTMVAQPA